MTRPPVAAQPLVSGCASACETAIQSSMRDVPPLIEKLQFDGQRNAPGCPGKIVPRITNVLGDASAAGLVPVVPSAAVAGNETSVGAKSNPPRDTLALISPIR